MEMIVNVTRVMELQGCRTAGQALAIAQADEWSKAEQVADKALAEYWEGYQAAAAVVSAGRLSYVVNVQ